MVMKRLVLLTLLIPFLFASCNKETEVEPVLTVSQSSIDAPAEGSSCFAITNGPYLPLTGVL